jgi:hypothetical protein
LGAGEVGAQQSGTPVSNPPAANPPTTLSPESQKPPQETPPATIENTIDARENDELPKRQFVSFLGESCFPK